MNTPFLLFHIDLRKSGGIIDGRLLLMEGSKIRERYIATSGTPDWQRRGDFDEIAKGPIPRPDIVNLDCYKVLTKADYVPEVVGIEGNFYAILPNAVQVPGGPKRSHFGIHRDANVPGSAGCVVLPTKIGWEAFQKQMKRLQDEGIEEIDLQIDYAV
jgi:hypothetical protein